MLFRNRSTTLLLCPVFGVHYTALSRVYLNHRISEDLDFLFKAERPVIFARDFSNILQKVGQCRVFSADIDGSEFSFIVNVSHLCSVKVELLNKPHRFDFIANSSHTWHGVKIEPIVGLCLGKMEALIGRKDVKDLIDLLAIFHKYPALFKEMLAECKQLSWSLDTNAVLAEIKKRAVQPDINIHLIPNWSWELFKQIQQDLFKTFNLSLNTINYFSQPTRTLKH